MKQRKSPVALITIAVFAGIGLMIAAKPFSEERLTNEEKAQKAQERAMEQQRAQMASNPTPKMDGSKEANELSQAMKNSVAKGGDDSKKESELKNAEDDSMPASPVVIKPEDKVYIPKPNSASTTSQWYDNK